MASNSLNPLAAATDGGIGIGGFCVLFATGGIDRCIRLRRRWQRGARKGDVDMCLRMYLRASEAEAAAAAGGNPCRGRETENWEDLSPLPPRPRRSKAVVVVDS